MLLQWLNSNVSVYVCTHLFRWTFAPVCLYVFVCGLLFTGGQESELQRPAVCELILTV